MWTLCHFNFSLSWDLTKFWWMVSKEYTHFQFFCDHKSPYLIWCARQGDAPGDSMTGGNSSPKCTCKQPPTLPEPPPVRIILVFAWVLFLIDTGSLCKTETSYSASSGLTSGFCFLWTVWHRARDSLRFDVLICKMETITHLIEYCEDSRR